MENLLLPAVLACAASLVLSTASLVWCTLFSRPAAMHKVAEVCLARAAEAVQRCEDQDGRFLAHKAETIALHEAIEGVLDSVEKKRRQVSGAVSRLNVAEQTPEPVTREDIVAAARAKVYGTSG